MYSSRSRPKAVLFQHHKRLGPTKLIALAVFIAAVLSVALLVFRTGHHLPSTVPATADALNDSEQVPGRVDDILVQKIVEKCMYKLDNIIAFAPGARKQQVVAFTGQPTSSAEQSVAGRCPLAVIPLAADDRSIGLCTDAALYVYLLGAWIVPGSPASEKAVQHCLKPVEQPPVPRTSQTRAVLFLEPLYDPWVEWLQQNPKTVAAFSPNFEQMFQYNQQAHKRMQLVLCKVHRCEELIARYLKDVGSNATLLYTGHTSLDPHAFVLDHAWGNLTAAREPQMSLQIKSAATAGQQDQHQQQENEVHLAASMQTVTALHVRGKSSLKHTKQLLDCWMTHPEWPKLTVVGPMPNEQITLQDTIQYMGSGNIGFPNAGKSYGAGFPEFEPLSQQELSNLLLLNALHIMPSEREGFGHSINEGRAAGALLLVPDHPPMSELMREGSGYLIKPQRVFSHEDPPVPVLGTYANISASISPQSICAAVSRALKFSVEERLAYGSKARQLFERDRRNFEELIKQVPVLLQQLAAGEQARQQQQQQQ